jgi:hypothetical protein
MGVLFIIILFIIIEMGENDQNTSKAGILIILEYLSLNQKLGRLCTVMS